MSDREKLGSGVVFPNNYKKTDNHPDFNGRLEFTCPGCKQRHFLDAGFWKKTTEKGKPMMTVSITPMPEEQAQKQKERVDQRDAEKSGQQPESPQEEQMPEDPFGEI